MDNKFQFVPKDEPDVKKKNSVSSADELCGIGSFKPKWLQRCADPKVYLVIYCIIGVVEGAYFTYFVGVLSTLEKRFAFESKISGIILIADNLSGGLLSLLAGYYGGKGHKPRMIAIGMVLVSLSSFLSALPYFIYGPALHFLSKDQSEFSSKKQEYCGMELQEEECSNAENNAMLPAVSILFLANFMCGFGYTAYYTIGTPYLDDNVRKKNSPMYFSFSSGLRVFGPVLGFLLSSFCLKFYEDPFYDPGIDLHNPRWVGCWWMGFLILGVLLLFFSSLLALFPRKLPDRFRSEKRETTENEQEKALPKLKDFPKELKRLMKNPILVCHTVSITFQVNGFFGYFIFMPKFMESQYQTSASDASLFSGTTGIVSMLVGILLGGLVIMKFKPRPRYLTGYVVLVEIFSVLGLLVSIFLGCPPIHMPGTNLNADKTLDLFNECNYNCSCTRRIFEPVCGADGISTFFSPCFAGCPNLTGIETLAVTSSPILTSINNGTVFDQCKCASILSSTFEASSVTSGFCPTGCYNMFMTYIILLSISKFISSTARVGNTLITFRCVEAKDKSLALGIFLSVLAIFALIPCPLIYGALTDSACLVWEESCGKTGNCWLYDSDKFRVYLHGASIIFISIGICFDCMVFLLSNRFKNFYGEEEVVKCQADNRISWRVKEEENVPLTNSPKMDSIENLNSVI